MPSATTSTASIDHTRMLDKVRALLAKAEASTFTEEAESFSAKAQQLMARYSIERALVEGVDHGGEPTRLEVDIADPYAKAKYMLLAAVAHSNRCEAIFSDRGRSKQGLVVGFPRDLESVEVLYTSLLLQATQLLMAEGSMVDQWGRSRTRSYRNSFLYGFAGSIAQRFQENQRQAESDFQRESGSSALPVLRSRADQVRGRLEELYPHVQRMKTSVSNGAGVLAGRRAGATADIGASRLGGSRFLLE